MEAHSRRAAAGAGGVRVHNVHHVRIQRRLGARLHLDRGGALLRRAGAAVSGDVAVQAQLHVHGHRLLHVRLLLDVARRLQDPRNLRTPTQGDDGGGGGGGGVVPAGVLPVQHVRAGGVAHDVRGGGRRLLPARAHAALPLRRPPQGTARRPHRVLDHGGRLLRPLHRHCRVVLLVRVPAELAHQEASHPRGAATHQVQRRISPPTAHCSTFSAIHACQSRLACTRASLLAPVRALESRSFQLVPLPPCLGRLCI